MYAPEIGWMFSPKTGVSVGTIDGERVGTIVDEKLGMRVGMSVGCDVGMSVGVIVAPVVAPNLNPVVMLGRVATVKVRTEFADKCVLATFRARCVPASLHPIECPAFNWFTHAPHNGTLCTSVPARRPVS